MKKGEVASLRLALSHTFDINLLMPHLNEVRQRFERLECRLLRGTAAEVVELLKSGDAELGIASDLGEGWDRLDRWPLFTEDFVLLVNAQHRLARAPAIELAELRQERLLLRSYCEHAAADRGAAARPRPRRRPLVPDRVRERPDVDAGVGPRGRDRAAQHVEPRYAGARHGQRADAVPPVHLYGVAGRQRTAVAALVMKMLRAADWSRHTSN